MLPAANVKFTPFTEDMKKNAYYTCTRHAAYAFFTAAGSTRKLRL